MKYMLAFRANMFTWYLMLRYWVNFAPFLEWLRGNFISPHKCKHNWWYIIYILQYYFHLMPRILTSLALMKILIESGKEFDTPPYHYSQPASFLYWFIWHLLLFITMLFRLFTEDYYYLYFIRRDYAAIVLQHSDSHIYRTFHFYRLCSYRFNAQYISAWRLLEIIYQRHISLAIYGRCEMPHAPHEPPIRVP